MKRFLKNAAVFASLAFCGLFILSNDVFADGGYYGFSQDSITLAPGNTGSVKTVAAPNDAGRRVSAGDAVVLLHYHILFIYINNIFIFIFIFC